MVARLAFSVATDDAPEILIVDEILAVGDADFQRKSLERIQGFRRAGATILMVSHSLETVQNMCTRAVWLDHGTIKAEGTADAVVRQYQGFDLAAEATRLAGGAAPETGQRWGSRTIEIVGVRLTNGRGGEQAIFETGQAMMLTIEYLAHRPVPSPIFGMAIHRQDGAHLTGPNTQFAGLSLPTLAGRGTITFSIPRLPLLEGLYHISVAVVNSDDTEMYDYHDRAYPFRVANPLGGVHERYGMITLQGEWRHGSGAPS
jgi:lipopolysaccharide transport system ATP-binding protein